MSHPNVPCKIMVDIPGTVQQASAASVSSRWIGGRLVCCQARLTSVDSCVDLSSASTSTISQGAGRLTFRPPPRDEHSQRGRCDPRRTRKAQRYFSMTWPRGQLHCVDFASWDHSETHQFMFGHGYGILKAGFDVIRGGLRYTGKQRRS